MRTTIEPASRFRRRGTGAVEYAVLSSLVAVTVTAALGSFIAPLNDAFLNFANVLATLPK